jgi:hypothetical protein
MCLRIFKIVGQTQKTNADLTALAPKNIGRKQQVSPCLILLYDKRMAQFNCKNNETHLFLFFQKAV